MDAINSPQFSQQKLGVMINIVPISERLGWFIANPNGRWFVIESNVLTFAWLDRGQTCYSLHILTWEMSGKLHGRTHISQKPALESAASSHSLWVIFRSVKTPVYPKCFLVFFPFFFFTPPVNVYIANWKDPPCHLMGKSTISTGPWLQ